MTTIVIHTEKESFYEKILCGYFMFDVEPTVSRL